MRRSSSNDWWWAPRFLGCEAAGIAQIYSSEKCEVSRGSLSGQVTILFMFSFFFNLWNSAAVHIFLRNTLYALRLIQVYERGALLPCILAVPDLFHWREILSGTFYFLNLKLISLMRNELYFISYSYGSYLLPAGSVTV